MLGYLLTQGDDIANWQHVKQRMRNGVELETEHGIECACAICLHIDASSQFFKTQTLRQYPYIHTSMIQDA